MSSIVLFQGSKKQARLRAREARDVARVKAELEAIAQLAKDIRDEAHLRQILADIPNDEDRILVSKAIEPFLPFKIQRVELAGTPLAMVSAGGQLES